MRSINSSNHHDHSLERNLEYRCFHRDTTKHTGVLKASSQPKQHGYVKPLCGRTVVKPVKTARVFDTPVWNTGGRTTMSSSRGKKAAVTASKERKGASSSAGPTTEIRHPLLQFPRGPHEELFQILRARP
ncbi:hypothetical protein GOBAR_AA13940 [Gossypium barbadense]|uniref:Uncharacterized protein n=1 Tax=Gossypium barbadense TaxID=3634 RepID=A0A2P5XTM1_GOSBA|nr:hypothetical protein GOBAR_AA13940 [Gossypium barbadense]